MENSSKITIPEDVVNPKEYIKMIALERHPIIRNTIYISSEEIGRASCRERV